VAIDPLAAAPDGELGKPLWRQNRIARHRVSQ
jgi:hypothetical protein